MNAQNSSRVSATSRGTIQATASWLAAVARLAHFLSYLAKSLTEYPSAHSRWISDLKLGDKGVEDVRCLCSCVNRAQGNLAEVDTP